MKKIALFLILQTVFLQMLESLAVSKVNKETQRNKGHVALSARNRNADNMGRRHLVARWCTYGIRLLQPHTIYFLDSPCVAIFCIGPGGFVKGCPPPENTTPSADKKSWPNCCSGWNPNSTDTTRRIAMPRT
uniref:Putative 8.9 kDa family member n=1 Tax=Rhipicephalus pulchellus TaxID=72859 RepID=L7MC60_RHIPC